MRRSHREHRPDTEERKTVKNRGETALAQQAAQVPSPRRSVGFFLGENRDTGTTSHSRKVQTLTVVSQAQRGGNPPQRRTSRASLRTDADCCQSSPAWRKSASTSNVSGKSPSAPQALRSSSKEDANAREAAQESNAFAKPVQLAGATSWVQIWHVPGPKRPPPTPPTPPCGGGEQVQVRSFRRLAASKTTPSRSPVPLLRRHQCCVNGQLNASEQRQSSATTSRRRPSLAALGTSKSRSRTNMLVVTLVSRSPKDPERKHDTMMAKFVNETATSAETLGKGRGRRRRRNRSTRKICESNPTSGFRRDTEKRTCSGNAREPARFLREPRTVAGSRNCCSTRTAASCCHPLREAPGSLSSVWANTIRQCWPTGPMSRMVRAASPSDKREGTVVPRSTCAATTGWRLAIMGKQSNQPNSPNVLHSSVAPALAVACATEVEMPQIWHRQSHRC